MIITKHAQSHRRCVTWITPCKRSAARGKQNCLYPEAPKELNCSVCLHVELLRSSGVRMSILFPELRFTCTGLSKFNAFGVAASTNSKLITIGQNHFISPFSLSTQSTTDTLWLKKLHT